MPGSSTPPDDFFTAEFGNGELTARLWRGGLRADTKGYTCQGARTLSDALKDGLDVRVTDGMAETLINEIETCWNDPARMRRACKVMGGAERRQSALSVSLVKLILSIDVFQPAMVTCIVNKISEYGEGSSTEKDIALLLLNQLRWLDFIVDGPALCENLLSIIPVISVQMQRAVIEALPEILDDSSRDSAVTELVRLLEESPSVMGSVVDALTALGVEEARLVDVNSSILSTVVAANRDMLPTSLGYLLRSCPQSLLTQTVNVLRHTLARPGLGADSGRLVLDTVRSGMRMRKPVADHVIKVLRGIEKPSEHRPADFWIIIALFDSPMHRKSAEVLFRKKAAKNMLSKALMDAALAPFAECFESITGRVIEMASLVAKSSELGARRTGIRLYALLFQLFPGGNTRRNVVMSLLEHTGTRRAQEMDTALSALSVIAKQSEQDRSLLPHSASIQGLLDFLECFSDSQLRQIWEILGYLCRSASSKGKPGCNSASNDEAESRERHPNDHDVSSEENAGESELAMLEILLRKELTHSDPFYRRIGVLGACTMVKVLGNAVKNNILTMLLDVGRKHAFCQALAFDELAQVFCGGGPDSKDTAESIRKTISVLFEKTYITDRAGLGGLTKLEDLRPAELFGNLEGDDIEFCFSISSMVRDEKSLAGSQDAVRAMVPNLRALCVLTASQYDGSLSEVDAIIGAPLHMPILSNNTDINELSSHSKADLLLSLFVAHGWVVELLNGFACQESDEVRAKCVKRVDDLLLLTSQIASCVSQIPLWHSIIYDAYHGTRAKGRPEDQGGGARKFSKSSKGVRVSRGGKGIGSGGARKGTEWQMLARQLDASALSLIRITSPITYRFTETESEFAREGEPLSEKVSLSSKGLLYLLSELASHVVGLVAGEYKASGCLSVSLFRPSHGGGGTASNAKAMSEVTVEARLKKFTALRSSLTALGQQLCRSMKKVVISDEEDLADGDSTLEIHRSCILLCLQSMAVALNSRILSDAIAEEFLFTVLASIRLDGSPNLEPSEPFTSQDVCIAAKQAFLQLRRTLQEVMGADQGEEKGEIGMGCTSLLGLRTCCAFLAAMDSVFSYCSEPDQATLAPKFSQSAQWLICHQWDVATLRSTKAQKLIPGVVKIFVQHARDPFIVVEDIRGQVTKLTEKQAQLCEKKIGTQDVNSTATQNPTRLASLTEQTCNAFTVSTLEQYLWLFKCFKPSSFDNVEIAFSQMESLIKAELPLYAVARQNQRMLGPVMRAGRTFVDLFLKTCLPFLKEHFKEHRSSVIHICKLHQKPTRLLQSFCAHSKSTRDVSLTGLVPPLRKSLELLLYRVKDLLYAHNATDAFQLGNLKHRDINGEVLSSQQLQYKSESDDGSEYGTDEDVRDDVDENDSHVTNRSHGVEKKRAGRVESASSTKREKKNGRKRKGGKKLVKEDTHEQQHKGSARSTPRPNLDFGSDADSQPEASDAAEDIVINLAEIGDHGNQDEIAPIPKRSKKRRITREDERVRSRRNPLIDDEAEGSDDGEDEEAANLSQFLVFGDEEDE